MSMAEQLSFERQVAAFLGGMAEDVPLGIRTPPRPMLRRARVQMTTSLIAGALIVALVIVVGTVLARGFIGSTGFFHHHLNDGSRISTDGSTRGSIGTGTSGVGAGAIGGSDGTLGDGMFGGFDGSYDPFGRLRGRAGPDGGAWRGATPRQGPHGVGGPGAPPGSKDSGAGALGGTGWVPPLPPPPVWGGSSIGDIPPFGFGDSGLSWEGASGAPTDTVQLGDDRSGRSRHRHKGK
jgi:hypothetical protein